MRICHFDFSKPFDMQCGYGVLIAESPIKFSQYCKDFVDQQCGKDGAFIVDADGKTLSFKKSGYIVFDYFNISLNEKKIVSGIYDTIEKTAMQEYQQQYIDIKAKMAAFADLLLLESPLQLEYNADFCVQDILKALKVQPYEEEKTLAESIVDYLDAMAEFLGTRIFVLVGLRLYLNDEEFSLLLKHIGHADYSVLFLERTQYNRVNNEPVRIIDCDFCEIVVEDDIV